MIEDDEEEEQQPEDQHDLEFRIDCAPPLVMLVVRMLVISRREDCQNHITWARWLF
jgi:hypothetical protein